MKGIFDLQSARDLLRKLQHDFDRMSRDPEDSFSAYDFFVTAHHLPEWMFDDAAESMAYREKFPILRVVRELGDSAKHYELTRPPATHAARSSLMESRYGLGLFGVGHYSAGSLLVHLTEKGQGIVGSSVIDARGLARRVLDHYIAELGPPDQPRRSRFDKS